MNSLKNCSNAYQVSVRSGISLPKLFLLFVAAVTSLCISSCGASRQEKEFQEKSQAIADSVSAYAPGIATDTINGVTHNFIRTANLKCKVKDVLKSTREVEQIVNIAGGYITKSELNSNKDYSQSIRFKKDSILEQNFYTPSCNINLRVPNKLLDSVINQITDLSAFVDFRIIHSDDVKLKLFANRLAENRYRAYNARVQKRIDKKDDKLNSVTNAEDKALEKQMLADDKRVETYDLADQVNYSTVELNLYQSQNIYSNVIATPPAIEPYEPPFYSKLGNSFLNGFEILKNIILFFVNLWSVILIMVVLYFATKKLVNFITKRTAVHAK